MPLVRLVDGTGGGGSVKSLETMGHTYVPFIPGWELAVENLSNVPVVAAALGPVAGLGAARVVASHFSVIVRDDRAAVRGGPAGGGRRDGGDARQGGARRRPRADARGRGGQRGGRRGRRARPAQALPLLPAVERLGGCRRSRPASDPADRREEELLSIVPRDRRKPYKSRRILEAVFDRGSLFELGARYGRSLITRARAARRPPRRRALLGPQALRRRPHRRRLREAHALRRRVRPVPPAGGELRRPAGLRDRHRGRARAARSGAARARSPPSTRRACPGCRCWCARSTAWPARPTATPRG